MVMRLTDAPADSFFSNLAIFILIFERNRNVSKNFILLFNIMLII